MKLNINLSEDTELRKAILGMVQEAIKTNIRDILKNTQADETLNKIKKSIESSINIIKHEFEYQNIYREFYRAILNEILLKIDINKIQQEIIQTVADRIYKSK